MMTDAEKVLALIAALKEAREYIVATVEENKIKWGDRQQAKQRVDISMLALVDQVLHDAEFRP